MLDPATKKYSFIDTCFGTHHLQFNCAGLSLVRLLEPNPGTQLRRNHVSHPVVLVTGALTGIGRATALAFAKEGARIVVSGRRDDARPRIGH
jgi:short chain dehydrogenase